MSHSQQRQRLRGMNAWDRHKQLMSDYQEYYGGQLPSQPVTVKTDMDCLIEQHRWDEPALLSELNTDVLKAGLFHFNRVDFNSFCHRLCCEPVLNRLALYLACYPV